MRTSCWSSLWSGVTEAEAGDARSRRTLYADALSVLLKGEMARLVCQRDFVLLREVARLAAEDAPRDLAATDPALFQSWRSAVTRYHLAGWSFMTPDRVDEVTARLTRAGDTPSETSTR